MSDLESNKGPYVIKLLEGEMVIWLTTVGRDLMPQPRPVWFVPDGEDVLIYSMPKASKVAHIRQHPLVALHFNCDEWGSDETVVVLTGRADLDPEQRASHEVPAYLEKYKESMAELGLTPRGIHRQLLASDPSTHHGDTGRVKTGKSPAS